MEGRGNAERDQRIDTDVAKTRVLNMLKQRHRRGERGLTNAEVRAVTGYTRQQVNRLIHDLEAESVRLTGHGRGATYEYAGTEAPAQNKRIR